MVRDWSLVTGRGGATYWENTRSETICAPPPQDRVKLFAPPPPFKGLKLFVPHPPPITMAKTSSSRGKSTLKRFVPPLQHGSNFFRPPFHRGKTSLAPPPAPVLGRLIYIHIHMFIYYILIHIYIYIYIYTKKKSNIYLVLGRTWEIHDMRTILLLKEVCYHLHPS